VELTDEQKQKFFDEYKGIPVFRANQSPFEYKKWRDKMRAEGHKDWEFL